MNKPASLHGIDEIVRFTGISIMGVLDAILHMGFPAEKTNGAWRADRQKVMGWLSVHQEDVEKFKEEAEIQIKPQPKPRKRIRRW
jgi:hypothetical protein